jgi:hypothetical protein
MEQGQQRKDCEHRSTPIDACDDSAEDRVTQTKSLESLTESIQQRQAQPNIGPPLSMASPNPQENDARTPQEQDTRERDPIVHSGKDRGAHHRCTHDSEGDQAPLVRLGCITRLIPRHAHPYCPIARHGASAERQLWLPTADAEDYTAATPWALRHDSPRHRFAMNRSRQRYETGPLEGALRLVLRHPQHPRS